MKHISAFVILVFLALASSLSAQSVGELEKRLERSQSKSEKMNLCYQIAEKLLRVSPSKSSDYAHRASLLASELGEKRREAEAIYLSAEGLLSVRSYAEAAGRFNQAWNTARNYGLRDVALNASEKLQETARKRNDLREELKWSRETVNYLKDNTGRGSTGGDVSRRLESQLQAAETDNRRLREELAKATGQTKLLETSYRETEAQFKEVQEKSQVELSKRDEELNKAAQEKAVLETGARKAEEMVQTLTKEQMADSILLAQKQVELEEEKARVAEAELKQEKGENQRNLLALLSGFALVFMGLLYLRYRAKRRMAEQLSRKNTIIETEQKKSDELLLNILPPAIAQELKARNKVAARKYEQATVMFIDFIGFTTIAEKLTPEQLVEELDHCFSNFDRIIGKYRIEKIKTVGDAYICASGLSDMNAGPSDMVKAALEIQDFLLHVKAERLSDGRPYFEARIGIHTGPVVAGVVGAKKFAYDIWGDTVNTAARLEESCEPGRVNVSEPAYLPAKYEFEWMHRGKIAAKNKGMLDMYYVTASKTDY